MQSHANCAYDSPSLLPILETASEACSGSWDGSVRMEVVVLSCRRVLSTTVERGGRS